MDAGRKPLADILDDAKSKDRVVSGPDAFLLYDTYGFPLEITMDAAADQGLQVSPFPLKHSCDTFFFLLIFFYKSSLGHN